MSTPTRRVTSQDVARASGVSRATVSYVKNATSSQTISKATRERVLAAAQELGYVPSVAAAALRRGHTNVVLLALDPLFSGHISDLVVESATSTLVRAGYTVVRHVEDDPSALVKIAQEINAFGVVSLAFLTADIETELSNVGVRRIIGDVVLADAPGPADRPWELPVGQLQVDHLVSTGRTDIIYALPLDSPRAPIAFAYERLRGARIECAPLGIAQFRVVERPLVRGEIVCRLRELEIIPGSTGVCAYDDQLAIGILGALHDMARVAPRVAESGSDRDDMWSPLRCGDAQADPRRRSS